MRKFISSLGILILSLAFIAISTSTVFAHTLKTDGSIGAVMHVSPEDDPVAGATSDFFFEFKDKNGAFDPSKCDCVITISENGNEIFRQALFQNNTNPSLTNASASFTFPQKDVYEIRLIGKPRENATFNPFTLTYDMRVERISGDSQPKSTNWFMEHIPHLTGGILGVTLLAFIMFKGRKKENS